MTELTGTAELTRFIVRRDRIRILVWVFAVAGLVALTVVGIKGLYPTQADLDQAAAASQGNAAAIVFNGPAQSLNTVGGEVAFQAGAMGMVVVALMSLLRIGRLMRATTTMPIAPAWNATSPPTVFRLWAGPLKTMAAALPCEAAAA